MNEIKIQVELTKQEIMQSIPWLTSTGAALVGPDAKSALLKIAASMREHLTDSEANWCLDKTLALIELISFSVSRKLDPETERKWGEDMKAAGLDPDANEL